MAEAAEGSQRLAEEYETLLEIGVQLASTLDLQGVLELALRRAEELCGAESSSIWELDEERGDLFFRVVRGRAASEIRGLRVPLGEGIVGSVARAARAEVVNDAAADARWRGDSGEFTTRALLTVPLVARGRVVGVLQLVNPKGRRGFSGRDLHRMRLFAGPLANALENARLYAHQKRQFLAIVTALAEAIEKRDPYTGGHVRRVVAYSLLLGQELGLSREALERLRLAATLHDVGKIAVPDSILNKSAPLDAAEVEIMRRHALDGAAIVTPIGELAEVLGGVRSHHERLDGAGYPDGLVDAQIPELARIIAVADAYDAMTTSRPYREARTPLQAAEEIRRATGAQLCPRVAASFQRLLDRDAFTLAGGEALAAQLTQE